MGSRKMIGGFLVVAVAVAALAMAVAADAVAPEYHDESAPATLTGSLVEGTKAHYKFGEGVLECSGETDSGTLSGTTSTSMKLVPSYSGCKLAGVEAEFKMEECDWVDHLEGGTNPPSGNVDLSCPEGKQPAVQQKGKNCVVTFEANQTGMPKFVTKNTVGPPEDFDRILTITGLKYTVKNCPFLKDGTYTNGEIEETVTVKADKGGGGTEAIWVE